MTHTPGPWRYYEDGDANHYTILTADKKQWVISFLHNGETMPEKQKSNMRLIAAAPEMLEALRAQHDAIDALMATLISIDSSFKPTESAVWPKIVQGHAAIKKATEDTP